MCIWMFSIKLSHFERTTWILVYDGCLFGEYSFIFNFVGYGLMTKSHGARYTFEEVGGESKMSKDECEL
jgi:hypothetical protein